MKALTLLVPVVLALSAIPAAAQLPRPGFSPADATHHFLLNKDGGVIWLEAANPEDPMTPDSIRAYLAQITKAGVPELSGLGAEANYAFEATQDGGQVVIRTKNSAALDLIHAYLRFQIRELQTGDSAEVQ